MKNKRERVLSVCFDGSHQFGAEIKEKEYFIASSQTGFYDKLAVKLFCEFLNLLPVSSHMNRMHVEEVVLCRVVLLGKKK